MPAATTHFEFAKDVYKTLDDSLKEKITNLPLFYLGSHGPDLFFFSHFSALPNSLKKNGNYMHSYNVKETITFMKDYVSMQNMLYSYYAGFICHYALDSNEHPLINKHAEMYHERYKSSVSIAHITSEAEIDCTILKERSSTINDYDVYKFMRVTDIDKKALATMYKQLFKEVYNWDIKEKDIIEAINGISKITKYLSPNSTKKYKFVTTVEDTFHLPKFVSGMMLNEKDSASTVLNEDHSIHFMLNGEDNSSSFHELYKKALEEVPKLLHNELDIERNFEGQSISSK